MVLRHWQETDATHDASCVEPGSIVPQSVSTVHEARQYLGCGAIDTVTFYWGSGNQSTKESLMFEALFHISRHESVSLGKSQLWFLQPKLSKPKRFSHKRVHCEGREPVRAWDKYPFWLFCPRIEESMKPC